MDGVRVEDLTRLPLLAGAPPPVLHHLAGQLAPVAVGAGEVLVREGEPADAFVLVRTGTAEVTSGGTPLARLGQGELVGELALLRGVPRTATVTALEPLTGWRGGPEALTDLLDAPGVSERLARTARQRLAALLRPVPAHLREGGTVLLRPVLPGDRQRAEASLAGFSASTLHKRFLIGRRVTDSVLRYLTEVDYVHHFVWLALAGDVAVADARLVRDAAAPEQAEVAFTVGDAFQGRGVGTLLVGALSVAAQELEVERFTASVLGENRPMRRLLDRAAGGQARWVLSEPGVVDTTVPVPDPGLFLTGDPRDEGLEQRLRDAVRQVVRAFG